MDTQIFDVLQSSISPQRIAPYRLPGDTNLETLVRYTRNLCLCETFYPLLHNLEIALRNNIHHAIALRLQDNRWLNSHSLVLYSEEKEEIRKAEERLRRVQRTVEPGRVIAELNFGFWTGLLGRRYEQILWPHIVNHAFPFLPHTLNPRSRLATHFTSIRHFRNRVFHHEPIWNRPSLQSDHDKIAEAIGWLNPQILILTQIVDRFSIVCGTPFQDDLKQQLQDKLE